MKLFDLIVSGFTIIVFFGSESILSQTDDFNFCSNPLINSCSNNGKCKYSNRSNKWKCKCINGFTGKKCEKPNPKMKVSVNWISGQNWANNCDFKGNDLSNVFQPGTGKNCGSTCAQTENCSHFTWTNYLGGTCWLKKGSVTQNDAIDLNGQDAVCGIITLTDSKTTTTTTITSNLEGTIGIKYNGIYSTRHGGVEFGACSLPEQSYSVLYPVALGDKSELGNLKFDSNLCGQILRINCGFGNLNIIVTNSNLGGGLDLYASTWAIATNNKPPGETQCSVVLSTKSAFNTASYMCYFGTGETNNNYYRNIGLLNTQGKRVISASLATSAGNVQGSKDKFNPYFSFGGFSVPSDQVTFIFDDGSSYRTSISNCLNGSKKHTWS